MARLRLGSEPLNIFSSVSIFQTKVYIRGFVDCYFFVRKEIPLTCLHGYKLFSIPCFLLSVSMALAQTAATPATPPPPKALAPDAVVLTIGNQKLTVKDIEDIIAALPSQYRPFYSGQGKPQLADFIIASKLLAEEARSEEHTSELQSR
jgi:hypothetical protein